MDIGFSPAGLSLDREDGRRIVPRAPADPAVLEAVEDPQVQKLGEDFQDAATEDVLADDAFDALRGGVDVVDDEILAFVDRPEDDRSVGQVLEEIPKLGLDRGRGRRGRTGPTIFPCRSRRRFAGGARLEQALHELRFFEAVFLAPEIDRDAVSVSRLEPAVVRPDRAVFFGAEEGPFYFGADFLGTDLPDLLFLQLLARISEKLRQAGIGIVDPAGRGVGDEDAVHGEIKAAPDFVR